MLIEEHVHWLEDRGLCRELAVQLGLVTKPGKGGSNWLAVPYVENGQIVNHKYRLTSEKRHFMDEGAPLTWWNVDCLSDPRVRDAWNPVIVTEGEWDAMAAMRAGRDLVLSVPNGADKSTFGGEVTEEGDAERFRFFWRSRELTDKVARFIIATDSDGPGRVLAHELVRRLGAERCLFVDYPDGCKDLGDVLKAHGVTGVLQVLGNARPYPVKNLYRMSEFPEPPKIEPMRVRVPHFYDNLPIVPGTFSVWTGYAGNGKTSLILAVVADLIRQGIAVAVGSFETMPKPILRDAMLGHLAGRYHGHLTGPERDEYEKMLEERLLVIAQQPLDDDDDLSLEQVLDLAAISVLRDGVRVILLDPWNEIEHKRRPDETETDYTGRAIRMMKRFAQRYQVALILIAHPKKPTVYQGKVPVPSLYDIAGSANFYNKADFGVVVHRPDKTGTQTDVHIPKVRMGLPGNMCTFSLDWRWQTSSYERVMAPLGEGEE